MKSIELFAAEVVKRLSQEIGARPAGSAGNRAAAEFIGAEMRRLGLAVEFQELDCPAWTCDAVELLSGDLPLEAQANVYSPACDVTAPLAAAGALAELEAADLSGKIALLYGDLTRAPIAPKAWFLKTEHDTRIVELLEEKAPLAVLTVQAQPGSANRIIEDQDFLIPSATLPAESALTLMSRLGQPATLRLRTRQEAGRTANVVGRRAGPRPETLVFCAHYDTKFGAPGATDNASGVAALLCAAELLRDVDLEAGVEFVAFTNEEYLPLGDDTYLEHAGADFMDRVLLAINFDALGHALDVNSLAIFGPSAEFQAEVERIARDFPGTIWVEPWPESNHSTFTFRGAPALAFSSPAAEAYAHQPGDDARWVNPARVAEGARLAARAARAVWARPVEWLRAG